MKTSSDPLHAQEKEHDFLLDALGGSRFDAKSDRLLERLGLDPAIEGEGLLPENRPAQVVMVDSHQKVASAEFIQRFLDMSIYIDYLWLIHSEGHPKVKAYDWLADKYHRSSDAIIKLIAQIEIE